MKRASTLLTGLVFSALLAPTAAPAAATPTCDPPSNLLQWPADDPVWELCWVRPAASSGTRGSGLELRDVHYNGHLVLKRAHAPMLNVEYEPGGCGCFRDWSHSEYRYRTDNELAGGYFEPPFPAETVCDRSTTGTPVGDCPWGGPGPCHEGVSAERLADRLVMTTQFNAGWYRYTMRWIFHLDGRIEPRFGFGTYSQTCSSATHRHHNYWRLDFDIDGAEGDSVSENGGTPFDAEDLRFSNLTTFWEVTDATTGRGYRLNPGAQDLRLPADDFSKTDLMISLYHPNELQDAASSCAVDVTDIVNGESVLDTDVVLWYRGGVQDRVNQDIFICKTVGPTLAPVGDWSPLSDVIFEDGFESGDTSSWDGGQP